MYAPQLAQLAPVETEPSGTLADVFASAAAIGGDSPVRSIDGPAQLTWQPVTCPLTDIHSARYGTFFAQQRPKILFSASYSNSANVLQSVLQELPKLVSWLGPDRVHVSINEGRSRDATIPLLHHLARALRLVGGSYTIEVAGTAVEDASYNGSKGSRIDLLAKVRNDGIRDLETDVGRDFGGFDTVVFVNDVRCQARERC